MLIGIEPSANVTIGCALASIVLVTVLNLGGTQLLARIAFFGFAAELVGAWPVGGWVLIT